MKVSRKLNLYIMHVLYLFIYFSLILTIEIIGNLCKSDIKKVEITASSFIAPAILSSFFWIYYTFSGKLSKTINKNYEE